MSEVTDILRAIEGGDDQAVDRLWPKVYQELRQLAAAQMAQERPGQTLAPTALVHEVYLRLAVDQEHSFANRRHFFGAAAQAMRRILVDSARSKKREKRGGQRRREFPQLDALAIKGNDDNVLALHEALEQFATIDPLKAKLVELRYFAGLALPEAADCLDISLSTANRAWKYARAWLYTAMARQNGTEQFEEIDHNPDTVS